MSDNKCNCGHDHEHNHDHGECGCGHDHNQAQAHATITLTLDDNSEVECSVLGTFDIEDKEYIALLPVGDDEVLIYSYKEDGEEVVLDLIESDEEFEVVSEVFYSLFAGEDDEDDEEYEYEMETEDEE